MEKDKVGGTCLHRGCIPTKALLHAGEVADTAREAAQFGIKAELQGVDLAKVHAYKDGVVDRSYKGLQGLIKAAKNVTLVEGEGRLTGRNTVSVGGRTLTGRNVVLATGSYSRTLPGLEIDGERVITSEHALTLDRLPSSVVILGGGIIGCEFASVWRSFGAEVTIVEALDRLLATEDEDSSKQVQRAFRRRGIKALLGKPFERVEHTDTGVRVTVTGGETLEADLLLVAVGRGPNTAGPGLRGAGHQDGARVRAHGRAAAHQRARGVRDRRHRARPAVGPPWLPARHLRGRGDRRAAAAGGRRAGDPAGHLL